MAFPIQEMSVCQKCDHYMDDKGKYDSGMFNNKMPIFQAICPQIVRLSLQTLQ